MGPDGGMIQLMESEDEVLFGTIMEGDDSHISDSRTTRIQLMAERKTWKSKRNSIVKAVKKTTKVFQRLKQINQS